jgi:hypothetical protein
MAKKKVIVHLSGGLGNQLFQFMAGVGLAAHVGKILEINTNWFSNPRFRHKGNPVYASKRKLDILQFESVATTPRELLRTPRDGRFERSLTHFDENSKRVLGIVSEVSFNQIGWKNPQSIRRLVGHFMSPKYFLSSTTEGVFSKLVEPLSHWGLELSKEIKSSASIGVHIRLGDYINLGDKVIPGESYFCSAVNYLKIHHGSAVKVFLFTDDPEQLRIMFPKLCALGEVISPPKNSSSVENLVLLAACSSFVCSNSTFSWWGAELSGAPKEMIVRPSYFYTAQPDLDVTADLWHDSSLRVHPITGKLAYR